MLSVHADQGSVLNDIGLPAVSGNYFVEGETLVFKPRFPFEPNVNYRAVVRSDPNFVVTSQFKLPSKSAPSTTVKQVYPTLDRLPENILKFYIQFSGPMSGGRVYEHIALIDSSGKAIELPFLEIDEELWDPEMTRLTLFIDPGRIKRGVRPLEEIGPALETGKSFTLRISRNWRDANGNPLGADFEKRFSVAPPDREMPKTANWVITPPVAKSSEPLRVKFDEAIDHGMAARVLRVVDATGKKVHGEVTLSDDDQAWNFQPSQPWDAGNYSLVVPSIIEDLAGNTIAKPFDVDTSKPAQPLTNSIVRLSFQAR